MLNIDLSGKTALVTGAGAGIGKAIAVNLAKSGAFVIVNYRTNKEGAQQTLSEIEQNGGSGYLVAGDMSKVDEVKRVFEEIAQRPGRLDILVNNAGGMVKRMKVAEMGLELWDEVMDINVKSTFLGCQAALPLMKGRGWGRIINLSSLAAHDGGGMGAAHYAAAKAAVLTFTKALAKEVASDGITVNCLAPGLINTAFHDVLTAPQVRQTIVSNTPLAREGQPDDVAGAVLFLASDWAAYITGETININGGQRLC